MSSTDTNKHVTVLAPGGRLSPDTIAAIVEIANRHALSFYLTTAQNLRLLGVREENIETVKQELAALGLTCKAPGRFPKPKVCVGMPYCNLAVADTFALSDSILARFGDRTGVKPKYKIALSGCPACCGGSKLADIGVVGTRGGFEVYVGGKGGALPKVGKRIARGLSADEVVELIGTLADFHAAKTPQKLRMYKLMAEPDFPFSDDREVA